MIPTFEDALERLCATYLNEQQYDTAVVIANLREAADDIEAWAKEIGHVPDNWRDGDGTTMLGQD